VGGAPGRAHRVAHDDGGGSLGGVQHSADRVIERGLCIEACTGRVGEPCEESVEETPETGERIPLSRRIQIQAQSLPLQDMCMMQESEVAYFGPGWSYLGSSDGDGD
jgi:hypothetical protein